MIFTFIDSGAVPSDLRLSLQFEGANGGTSFTDSSPRARAVANASGLVTTSTALVLDGTSSGLFPGTANAFLTLDSDASSALTGNFAIRALVQFDSNGTGVGEGIYGIKANVTTRDLYIYRDSTSPGGHLKLWFNGNVRIDGGPCSGGEVHELIVERVGSTITLVFDGIVRGTYTSSDPVGATSGTSETVGAYHTGGTERLVGVLDDLEVYANAEYNGAFPTTYKRNDWVYVNKARTDTSASGTTLSLAAQSLTTGNNIFVFIRYEVSGTTTSVSDTAGNTYTGLTEVATSNGACGRWFYCLNAIGHASNVITVTWGAAKSYRYVYSVQYAKASASFDVEQTKAVAAAGTIDSNAFSTAGAGLVLVGHVTYNNENISAAVPTPVFPLHRDFYSDTYAYQTGAALSGATITVGSGTSTTRGLCLASFV